VLWDTDQRKHRRFLLLLSPPKPHRSPLRAVVIDQFGMRLAQPNRVLRAGSLRGGQCRVIAWATRRARGDVRRDANVDN
jgi:hypothetical protein